MHNNLDFLYPHKWYSGREKPTRDIRQDAHLSPYIFVICAEYPRPLSALCVKYSKIRLGIQPEKEASKIPYLMFADDYIIFSRVIKKAAMIIIDILESYDKVSAS